MSDDNGNPAAGPALFATLARGFAIAAAGSGPARRTRPGHVGDLLPACPTARPSADASDFGASPLVGSGGAPDPGAAAAAIGQAATATGHILQVLTPPKPWDWGPAAIGEQSHAMHAFCDQAVESVASSAAFRPGAGSFSTNYQAFLRAIDAAGPGGGSALAAALAAATPPAGDPAGTPSPDGWARVPDEAGILRWGAIYGVDLTPEGFAALPDDGDARGFQIPVTPDMRLQLTDDQGRETMVAAAEVIDGLGMRASLWQEVSVSAGPWFQPLILRIRRSGPFLPGFAAKDFFGEDGLLAGRIAQLIVARDPSLTFAPLARPGNPDAALQLAQARRVCLAGYEFPLARPGERPPPKTVGARIVSVRLDALP